MACLVQLAVTVWCCGLLMLLVHGQSQGEGGGHQQGACTEPSLRNIVSLDALHAEVTCLLRTSSRPLRWTKATDLCDSTTFTDYDICTRSSCDVPNSEYLGEENTFFCCESMDSPSERQCHQIFISPTATFEVPGVVRQGREETAYAVVISKPRPSTTPPVKVVLETAATPNGGAQLLPINVSSTEIVPSPLNPLKFIIVYNFVVPTNIEEGTMLRLTVHTIDGWTVNGTSSFENIPIIAASSSGSLPPTVTTSPSVNSTDGEEPTVSAFDGSSIPIPVLSVLCAILFVVAMAGLTALVCCFCFKKKLKDSPSSDSTPPTVNTPTLLNLTPDPSSRTNSTLTSPGQTPQTETTGLLSGSAGGVAHDHSTGIVGPSLYRQNSGDSGLMTTPTESEQPFPGPTGLTSFAGSSGNDSPERHIYSTIGQVLPSFNTGAAPPTTDSQQLSQLYHTSSSSCVHMVHVHSSTTSLSSRSELFHPPLPADKPGYASQGSMMHLLPQERSQRHCNVSNV